MSNVLTRGYGHWRRQGTRAFVRILVRKVARTLAAPVLRIWPRRVSDRQLSRALGGSVGEALERATNAQPPLAEVDRALRHDGADEGLIRRANAICDHRFDVLGAQVDYGPEIDWRRDPGSGAMWPMRHRSTMPKTLGGGSDVRRVWEIGRMQHLPLLAIAWRRTAEPRFLDEIGAQLRSFAESQPVEFGPQWMCPMDVSIRAANIIAAACLVRSSNADWLEDACRQAYLHGRFVRSNLEWSENRGNHYLSDVVGLVAVAALFSGPEFGQELVRWCAAELTVELERQIYPDGGDFEASLYYHRLVYEMFWWGLSTAEQLARETVDPGWRDSLAKMAAVTAACSSDVRSVPQIGDSDDARYVPFERYGLDPADHSHMFELLGSAPGSPSSRSFPDVGWHVLVAGGTHVVVRCGLTGRHGIGGHCHNDQLAVVVHHDGVPVICDPGTFAYTGDPVARDRFRSTGYHATIQIDGSEQNPLDDTRFEANPLFVLPDRTRAAVIAFDPDSEEPGLEGVAHWDHLSAPALHRRAVKVSEDAVEIVDSIESAGSHDLVWTFPLPARSEASADGDVVEIAFENGTRARLLAPGCVATVIDGEYSPRYGVADAAPFARFTRGSNAPADEQRISLEL